MQASTNNVNMTWALLQTTRVKDELNIVFMQIIQTNGFKHWIIYNGTMEKMSKITWIIIVICRFKLKEI
jgi:hypothetical protein